MPTAGHVALSAHAYNWPGRDRQQNTCIASSPGGRGKEGLVFTVCACVNLTFKMSVKVSVRHVLTSETVPMRKEYGMTS